MELVLEVDEVELVLEVEVVEVEEVDVEVELTKHSSMQHISRSLLVEKGEQSFGSGQ